MAVVVSFVRVSGIGAIATCRVMEKITVPGTTTATCQEGETVLCGSSESSMVLVAHGSTPDAQATAETAATSAGYPLLTGGLTPIRPRTGDKINIKAVP
jgi:hypothetical protein